MNKAAPKQESQSVSDQQMIAQLVNALQVVLDTPVSGPRSAGDWKSAEKLATNAIDLARSRDSSIP